MGLCGRQGRQVRFNKQQQLKLIFPIQNTRAAPGAQQMNEDLMLTPKPKISNARLQKTKKFVRKPAERSERSQSKRSNDSSVKQMYIKSPTEVKKSERKEPDFFATLASSMITKTTEQNCKNERITRHRRGTTDRYSEQTAQKANTYAYTNRDQTQTKAQSKIKTLEAEIDLKNHQIAIVSGEVQRLKDLVNEEKDKRKKSENEKKQVSKQLKEMTRLYESLQLQIKKHVKEKQLLLKQIEFLQRINFDEKTRGLQSYREKYLETEVQRLKLQIKKTKSQREEALEDQIKTLKQQRYTMQSHYKATKVANQCLIKQINNSQDNLHDIILHSEEYTKLRDKYLRFLEQYKLLRNEYWALKAEINNGDDTHNQSSLFSLTASEVENDLSILKGGLAQATASGRVEVRLYEEGGKSAREPKLEPTYSFK